MENIWSKTYDALNPGVETKTVWARTPAAFDAWVKLRDKSTMTFAEQKAAFSTPLIKDATLNKSPSKLESFEGELSVNPVTKTRETGGYTDKVITMGKNAPWALSNLFKSYVPANTMFGWLDVEKAAWAVGNVLWGIPAAIPSMWIWLSESTADVTKAKGIKDTAIKLTSVPVKTLMPL